MNSSNVKPKSSKSKKKKSVIVNSSANSLANSRSSHNTNIKDDYVIKCREVFSKLKDHEFFGDKVQHIYFYGEVDQDSVQKLREDIVEANKTPQANADNGVKTVSKPIVIHIHNPGGDAYLGLTLPNWLRESRLPIAVMVDGYACSATTPLLVSAPYRVMHSHAFVMIHEGSMVFPSPVAIKFADFNFLNDSVTNVLEKHYLAAYKENTDIPEDVLKDLLTRDKFIDSAMCKEWNVVDRVIEINRDHTQKHWLQYYENHPDMVQKIDPLLWKINYNHIYLYNNSTPEIALDKSNISRIMDLKKVITPLQRVLETSVNVRTPKPVVLHSNMYMFPDKANLYDMAAVMIRIALSRVPIISIIDTNIELLTALPCIMCHKRYMYKNTNMIVQLVFHHSNHGIYYHDMKENTEMMRSTIRRILEQNTRLPKAILDNLFEKRMIFSAEQCKSYGIIDEIIEPLKRRK